MLMRQRLFLLYIWRGMSHVPIPLAKSRLLARGMEVNIIFYAHTPAL